MMPSRMRSWMRRSRSGSVFPAGCAIGRGTPPSCVVLRAVFCLATIPPGYDESENNVQATETAGEKITAVRERTEDGPRSGCHKTDPHYGHDSHRKSSPCHDAGSIKKH